MIKNIKNNYILLYFITFLILLFMSNPIDFFLNDCISEINVFKIK